MRISRVGKDSKLAGFTLIELMVSMTIVGVILAVVVGGMGNFLDSGMKEAAARLASTMRYLYNKSATERLYIRIVFDFGSNAYRVEASAEPFLVTRMTEQDMAERKKSLKAAGERGGEPTEEQAAEPNPFSGVESYLLENVSLGDDIFLKDVQTSYQASKIEEGEAYIYFFPNGYATPGIINLTDRDDEVHYSLEVLALSGRVRIESNYRDFYAEMQ